jgi:hypothetical protein
VLKSTHSKLADAEVCMQAAHIPPNCLQALRQFLADETPEQELDRQVSRVAELVGAASCSVMLSCCWGARAKAMPP